MQNNLINPEKQIAENTKLIREMFDFTVTKRQFDLIYAIISLVKPTDNEFKEYVLSYQEVAKIINPKNPYTDIVEKDIEKTIKEIMKSCFRIQTDETDYYYHWVEKAKNNKKAKTISFKLNCEVQQFYLQLNKGEYTVYLLKDLLALSTIFQANLFRWLCCNSGFYNDVEINIEKAKLCFYGKNIESNAFIRKVESALTIINKRTNISATYEKIKSGRKIISLKFNIKNNYIKEKKSRSRAKTKADIEKNKEMWQICLDTEEKCRILEERYEKVETENMLLKARLEEKSKMKEMITESVQNEMKRNKENQRKSGIPKFDLFD